MCHLALCRSRSLAAAANCRRAKSRLQLRSKSARFASVSEGRSTGGRCARCLRQSGRLADDRAPTWVVDLDRDAADRFPSGVGLTGDAGQRGVWGQSVRRRTLCLPGQAPRSREDPDLGRKRPCPLLQKNRGQFTWPPIKDGVMPLSHAQLSVLLDGSDWKRVPMRVCGSASASWLIRIKSSSSLMRSCCKITLHE
ncbi:hypothetical protein ABIB90_007887 [Bradyrhizobium sp. JR4.1]